MDRHLKKIVYCVSNGDLDNLKRLYVQHKQLFGPFLYNYAIRNNQIKIIDYLYNGLLYEINGISRDTLFSSNGGRRTCDFSTMQYIVEHSGIKGSEKIYQRCIDILINNRKFKKAVEYAKGSKTYYPGSFEYLLSRFDLAYPPHVKRPDELIEIYRDIAIIQILE